MFTYFYGWIRKDYYTLSYSLLYPIKTDAIKNILSSLTSYHSNIQFTMKIERNNQSLFLDVFFFIRRMETISTSVYHRVTNTDIYFNWKSFSLINWKWEHYISKTSIWHVFKWFLFWLWITIPTESFPRSERFSNLSNKQGILK